MFSHGFNGISRGLLLGIAFAATGFAFQSVARGDGLKTWDGRHSIDHIEVTMVYFLPSDRTALPDWKDRVEYFASRIKNFHAREYDGQSELRVIVREEPFVSELATAKLREGDANAIYFRTLREVAAGIDFPDEPAETFSILLVLSDINWRPLEDFYRVHPTEDGFEFEGQFINGYHFPGAASGGARAAYLADQGVGWGLVSADGWRVPYRGTDCVVYHEGVGHTVGLPHPEPQDGSVMSLAQYRGWINESWLKESQKRRMGWTPPEEDQEPNRLFTAFRALPEPKVPHPGEPVSLACDWPEGATVESCRVAVQTELLGPWREIEVPKSDSPPETISLGTFEAETPVSYRIQTTTANGETVELWGYFQVRSDPETPLIPPVEVVPEEDREIYREGEQGTDVGSENREKPMED